MRRMVHFIVLLIALILQGLGLPGFNTKNAHKPLESNQVFTTSMRGVAGECQRPREIDLLRLDREFRIVLIVVLFLSRITPHSVSTGSWYFGSTLHSLNKKNNKTHHDIFGGCMNLVRRIGLREPRLDPFLSCNNLHHSNLWLDSQSEFFLKLSTEWQGHQGLLICPFHGLHQLQFFMLLGHLDLTLGPSHLGNCHQSVLNIRTHC